jgi:small multidrug resistance family-3 protein
MAILVSKIRGTEESHLPKVALVNQPAPPLGPYHPPEDRFMPVLPALLLLTLAAFLESGGDGLVRKGLIAGGMPRGLWFVTGAAVLFVYGVVVNAPGWDFGRMLGVYVALFFVAAQVIAYFVFRQSPTMPVLVGGVFIVAGGLIMTFRQGGLST